MSISKSTNTPPTRSLNRQVVLDEDEYTEGLAHIIARDFFPSLVHLDATNNYLDALKSQDPDRITASVRRLEELNTPVTRRGGPSQTPLATPYGGAGFETPLRTPRGETPAKRLRYSTEMGLDAFQARYTSEDNSSFLEILDDENKKRKERYDWVWQAQKRVEEQRDKMIEGRQRLLIEAPDAVGVREKLRIEAPAPVGLITQGESSSSEDNQVESGEQGAGGGQLIVRQVPEDEEEVDAMAPKKDKRSAGVDGWKFKARNALMFAPDADVSPHVPTGFDKMPDPKTIRHGNTRLVEQEETSEPPSPTSSRIDAAIAGTQYQPRSPNSKKFPLVPAMPSPTPSELGPAAVKQLMTWGTLNATPRIISSEDPAESSMPPPSALFHLPVPSSRECISRRLSSSASKSLRAKAELIGGRVPGISRTPSMLNRTKGSMGPPTWTPKRADAAGGLTPAAKRLLDRTMATRRSEAMERTSNWQGSSKAKEKDANRIRWTPTPSPVTRRE